MSSEAGQVERRERGRAGGGGRVAGIAAPVISLAYCSP